MSSRLFAIYHLKAPTTVLMSSYHWYVVIICNPGSILKTKDDQVIQGKPFFLILDSLGTDQGKQAISALRYLKLIFESLWTKESLAVLTLKSLGIT